MKYYIAYGSNLNKQQMALRCPTAKLVATAELKGWELVFYRVASIEPKEGARTPIAIWLIDKTAEKELDRYEGFPTLYRKENLAVNVRGHFLNAMVYIMNYGATAAPSERYYKTILQGYRDMNLDPEPLERAVLRTFAAAR